MPPYSAAVRRARSWLICCLLLPALAATADQALLERGRYVLRLAGCAGCHTDGDHGGEPLAGGGAIATSFGVFYAPNITPHEVHGIGAWSEADFRRALTEGTAPDGRVYFPVFPYPAYTGMRADDLRALWAYLQSLPAVAAANRDHELAWPARLPWAARAWRFLHFSRGPLHDDPERALAHCGECHTPRDKLGAPISHLYLAGGELGAKGATAPNITPDRATGIGTWSEDDLAYFFETGALPDGDYTGGMMAEVLDNGLKYLTAEDAHALIVFLRALPPIRHVPEGDD
jgi:mono/diheme cytochrome c family protein